MGSPSSSLATLRPDLAAGLEEFDLEMDRKGFIGHRVLPTLPVASQAGIYPKLELKELLASSGNATKRTSRAGYNRGDWTFGKGNFATDENGWEEPVDDREAAMYAHYFNHEQVATRRATDIILRAAEIRIASLVFNTTTWTGSSLTTAITHEWDDATNAVPISDVKAAKQAVWDLTGVDANALIINKAVFDNLRTLDEIKDAIASSGAGYPTRTRDITLAQLQAVFDLDHILVAGSAKNTANEGQDAALSRIWSNEYAMVCRIEDGPDVRDPCVGRTFAWGGDGVDLMEPYPYVVETYRDETVRGDVVRVRHDTDEQVINANFGHLLSNVTT